MRTRVFSAVLAGPVMLGLGLLGAGCGGGRFGTDLSQRPQPYALAAPAATTLHLPQERPFNITLGRSNRAPGLSGSVEADAATNGQGTADARVSIQQGGQGEALIQLGHALRNDTDRQTDVDFLIRVQFELEAATQPAENRPGASVGLRLYARDQRGRLRHEAVLVDYTTESGAVQRIGQETVRLTLTLAPGDALDLFLAGRVVGEVEGPRSAAARLQIRSLQYEITTQPAPPVRTAPS